MYPESQIFHAVWQMWHEICICLSSLAIEDEVSFPEPCRAAGERVSGMGIQGLLAMVDQVAIPTHIKEFKGKVVAVDASTWLHRGVYGCALEIAQVVPALSPATQSHLPPLSHVPSTRNFIIPKRSAMLAHVDG